MAGAAKAAMSDLPLLFTAAAFLSEGPVEPFGSATPGDFRPQQAPTSASRIISDQNRAKARNRQRRDASGHCWALRHRLALLRRRPRVRGSAREDSCNDLVIRAGSSPLHIPRRRPAPRFRRPERLRMEQTGQS